MITNDVATLIGRFPLGIVATMTPDGRPAASPKGTFLVLGERQIAFGDIRSPGTLRNLGHQPQTEVVFIDPFARKGARLAGTATVHAKDSAEFIRLHPKWAQTWGDLADRIKALVVIDVASVKPLTTPPYDDGMTEAEMVALYKTKYAEIYP